MRGNARSQVVQFQAEAEAQMVHYFFLACSLFHFTQQRVKDDLSNPPRAEDMIR